MKPLLVGESCGGRGCLEPGTSSGRRLMSVLRVGRDAYLEGYLRTNLCDRVWCAADAAARARVILLNAAYKMGPDRLVLLGVRVSAVFGGVLLAEIRPFSLSAYGDVVLAAIPHPSGRCRVWNDPGAERRARRILRELRAHGG